MAKVVLHVGAHKTGTTYLQNLFHENRSKLAEVGVHYPDIGPNTAHHALARSWIKLPDVPDEFFGSRGADGLWDDLIAKYADLPGIVFLSAENFSRCYPEQVDMADLARRLSAFEDVRVLYTMRRQTEMVQSLWLQLARFHRPLSIYSYVHNAIELRRAVGVRIDHGSFYDVLLGGFAPEQIHFLDYSQIRRVPGGIGQFVLDLLDTGLKVDDFAKPQAQENNVSPDPLGYWIACQITRNVIPDLPVVEAVTDALAKTGQPDTLLARHEYVRIASRYASANEKLVERLQQTQPGFTFEETEPPENLLYRDEIPDTVWLDILARIHALPPAPKPRPAASPATRAKQKFRRLVPTRRRL